MDISKYVSRIWSTLSVGYFYSTLHDPLIGLIGVGNVEFDHFLFSKYSNIKISCEEL